MEKVRTPKGFRQRLIRNLGGLDIHSEQYKELANCIEGFLTTHLFDATPDIEKHARKAAEKMKDKRGKESHASSEQSPEEALSKRERHLFSLQEKMCFFDLTNT